MYSSGWCAAVTVVHRHDVELVLAPHLRIVIIADTVTEKNKYLYKIVPGVRAGDTLQQNLGS